MLSLSLSLAFLLFSILIFSSLLFSWIGFLARLSTHRPFYFRYILVTKPSGKRKKQKKKRDREREEKRRRGDLFYQEHLKAPLVYLVGTHADVLPPGGLD